MTICDSDHAKLLELLAEGARIEVGRSGEIAATAIKHPELVPYIIDALAHDNAVIVSHAAQTLLKLAKLDTGSLAPYKAELIATFELDQWEIHEQLAKILPLLNLQGADLQRVLARIEYIFVESHSSIARTCAMQAMVDLARKNPSLEVDAMRMLTMALNGGAKAMQARARKLMAELRY